MSDPKDAEDSEAGYLTPLRDLSALNYHVRLLVDGSKMLRSSDETFYALIHALEALPEYNEKAVLWHSWQDRFYEFSLSMETKELAKLTLAELQKAYPNSSAAWCFKVSSARNPIQLWDWRDASLLT